MAVIRVEHLKKEFEYYKKGTGLQGSLHNLFHREMLKKEAVKDISFSVERGEMIGLLGPNGAGKTTTLKMLSGILFPTAGEVEIDGYIPWERKNAFKRRFSIVMGQKNQLWWDLPASDSFYLNKCIFDVPDGEYRRTVEELSELLDVKDLMNVQVRRLSLGERMKMEILAALIHRPDILFLDEPTIGLDILSQQKIRDFLKTYNEQTKTTVILTSHYMRDIEELCRRAVIINQGQLVFDGTLADINHRMGDRKLLSLKSIEPVLREHLSLFGRVREYHGREAVLEVPKGKIKETASAILSLLPVEDFTVTEIPLEESISLFFQKEVTAL
ncbi:multidrug ABC transporter ATP-binding protein [Eisenbergiella tayi]|uniref:Methionine import ATP-binding protein MetN 2 n=1 Tax=Eisenbergiella tayi TaxID=1432052 RepID=A0A1E3AX31_9FIRM|nr:ABC transporter ATP-binding protein [Eisenbergiella tayi]ODM13273.1 Methionine import ATP-binding protein MetN 2 [Eisenbergiella tayi]OIZ65949.1 multidrug ABC transporter ATP-binding protein [Eisenbergiella tayi]